MNRIVLSCLAVAALTAVTACMPYTEFNGSAFFPGGAQGCFASCQQQNMEMSGFVTSGEFASSCVCRPRPVAPATTPAAAADKQHQAEMDASDVAALTGVVLQKRRQEEEARGAQAQQNAAMNPAMNHTMSPPPMPSPIPH